MTREQIGSALEYKYPTDAIYLIHKKNPDRIIKNSATFILMGANGKPHETYVYTLKGAMEICLFSRQPKADKFMNFVWDVMEALMHGETVLAPVQ